MKRLNSTRAFLVISMVLSLIFIICNPNSTKASSVGETIIKIDPAQELGSISPEIYGVNHRYFDHGVGMWDPTTMDAYSKFNEIYDDIKFKSLRYPGGTVGNTFDWKRSIGPINEREKVIHSHILNLSPQDTDFGLDEVARYCEKHGTEMVYVYNMGNGNAQDAADLVEYLNAPNDGSNPNGGADWAAVRAANGHPEPYNIKSFEIGNEMYIPGQLYWLAGISKEIPQKKYAFGAEVKFIKQPVGLYDDWMLSSSNSDGTTNQHKYAKYTPIILETETIYVGGKPWKRADNLIQCGNEDVYEIDYSTGKITFGDGVHGRIPPLFLPITITYTAKRDGYVDYYKAMKDVDSTIKIYSCYHDFVFMNIMGKNNAYDGVAIHPYAQTIPPYSSIERYHDKVMLMADEKANYVKKIKAEMQRKADSKMAPNMDVIVSEYGILSNNAPVENYLSSLDHGLYVAKSIMSWIELELPQAQKHCLIDYSDGDELGPGQQAIIGGYPYFIQTPTAYVFKMFTHMFGPIRISSDIICNPTRDIYMDKKLEKIKTVSSKDDDGNLYIMVANIDREDAVTATIEISNYVADGDALIWTLNGPSYTSYNTVDEPDAVSIGVESMKISKVFTYTFPAHSLTAIKVQKDSKKVSSGSN